MYDVNISRPQLVEFLKIDCGEYLIVPRNILNPIPYILPNLADFSQTYPTFLQILANIS